MTRKDYIIIADICVLTIKQGFMHDPNEFIELVTAQLLKTNSNFDAAKFEKYIKKKL